MNLPAKAKLSKDSGAAALPIPTLVSQVLVAFTIELDNEFEQQMPHRTTTLKNGNRIGPWLVSFVMWSNLMRVIDDNGATVAELERRAHTARLSLAGMQRWGYIVAALDPADTRPKPPHRDWRVYPTSKGRRAQEVWRALPAAIEQRWAARFGKAEVFALRESLNAIVNQLDVELPDYLPVVGYGLFAEDFPHQPRTPGSEAADAPLPALLSKVLYAFTIEFEREFERERNVSLAISANVLRLFGEEGDDAVRLRDLPRLSGVSKEGIKMAVGFLEKGGYLKIEPEARSDTQPGTARTKVARLTPKGLYAQETYVRRLAAIEEGWKMRFGEEAIGALRAALQPLVGEPTAEQSPLFQGLEPPLGGWRAEVPRPSTLPHYPMVLHRGGFPDGS